MYNLCVEILGVISYNYMLHDVAQPRRVEMKDTCVSQKIKLRCHNCAMYKYKYFGSHCSTLRYGKIRFMDSIEMISG